MIFHILFSILILLSGINATAVSAGETWEEMEPKYIERINADKKNPDVYFEYAEFLYRHDAFWKAESIIEKILEMDKEHRKTKILRKYIAPTRTAGIKQRPKLKAQYSSSINQLEKEIKINTERKPMLKDSFNVCDSIATYAQQARDVYNPIRSEVKARATNDYANAATIYKDALTEQPKASPYLYYDFAMLLARNNELQTASSIISIGMSHFRAFPHLHLIQAYMGDLKESTQTAINGIEADAKLLEGLYNECP